MEEGIILLNHGGGGKLSQELIRGIFFKHFGSYSGPFATDSALIDKGKELMAFTTDSYVVDPIFFPGGNIGKLAVCGTVNDLAVSGAIPMYLSCGFIIEEGFSIRHLEEIVATMAQESQKAGVRIVAGDTKVVDKGKCDKIFINTAGIGLLEPDNRHISFGEKLQPGDSILINGSIGDHSVAVMAARNNISLNNTVISDCAPLNAMIAAVMQAGIEIKFMRDATRGGLATVLCEIAEGRNLGIEIDEEKIPLKDAVEGFCEVLGFDPLYMANEGKVVMIVPAGQAADAIKILQRYECGQQAAVVGEITGKHPSKVMMNTGVGGKRMLDMLSGEQLPRIC